MKSPDTPKKARTLRWNLRSTPQRTKDIPWDLRPAARPNPQTDILTPPITPRRRRVQRSTKPTTQRPKRRESGRAKERRNNAPRGLIRADALGQILPGAVATQPNRSFSFMADEDAPAQTRSVTFTPAPATVIPLGTPTPPGTPRALRQEEPPLLDQNAAAENERFMVGFLANKARTFENEDPPVRRWLEHIPHHLALAGQFDHDDILATDTMDGVETNTIQYGHEGTELVDEEEPPSRQLRGAIAPNQGILQRTDSELARLPQDSQNETSATEEHALSEQVPAVGVPVPVNQAGIMVHNESGLETDGGTDHVVKESEVAGIKYTLRTNGEIVVRGAIDNPRLKDFICALTQLGQQSNGLADFLAGQPFNNCDFSGQFAMAPPPAFAGSYTAPGNSLMAEFDNLDTWTAEPWTGYPQTLDSGSLSRNLGMADMNMTSIGQDNYNVPSMPTLDVYGTPLAGPHAFAPQAAQFDNVLPANHDTPINSAMHSDLAWGQDLPQLAPAPAAYGVSAGATGLPFGQNQGMPGWSGSEWVPDLTTYYATSHERNENCDDRNNMFVEGSSRDGQGFES